MFYDLIQILDTDSILWFTIFEQVSRYELILIRLECFISVISPFTGVSSFFSVVFLCFLSKLWYSIMNTFTLVHKLQYFLPLFSDFFLCLLWPILSWNFYFIFLICKTYFKRALLFSYVSILQWCYVIIISRFPFSFCGININKTPKNNKNVGSLFGKVANGLEFDIIVSKFEIHLHTYPASYGLNCTTTAFLLGKLWQ